jgi:nitrite reductase/ring-hydroxylating ferredoxin subunit
MRTPHETARPEGCDGDAHEATGCDAVGRRGFLRDGLAALAAVALVAGGAGPLGALPLEAMPWTTGTGTRRDARTVRYPVPAADGVTIDATNEVILVRWQGELHAFNLSCPHQRTALRWQEGAGIFRCPKHKSRYQPTGVFIDGKATRNMDRFRVRKEGAEVVVEVDAFIKSDADAAGWAAAGVKA